MNRSYIWYSIFYFNGIILIFVIMLIAFIGYILTWGQMSFWGGTVIMNIFLCVPSLMYFLLGHFYVTYPTIYRFFIIHVIIPFSCIALIIIHTFHIHIVTSSNSLNINTITLIELYPYVLMKDVSTLYIYTILTLIQCIYSYVYTITPINNLTINENTTPNHIVPEWYFLTLYLLLKVIPNKSNGLNLFILQVVIFL
jgi:ubiquinol-cytochrome c reductase cytochrome b subunit